MLIILTILLLNFGFLSRVAAVSTENYLNKSDLYRTSYEEFLVAKSSYSTSKSVAAEKQLTEKAKLMLSLRTQVWKEYWTILEQQINEILLLNNPEKELMLQELKAQINSAADRIIKIDSFKQLKEIQVELINANLEKDYFVTLTLQANTLINYGKINYALSELVRLNSGLLDRIKSGEYEEKIKEEKINNLTNIGSELETIKLSLNDVFVKTYASSSYRPDDPLGVMIEKFEPITDEMKILYSNLEEISNGVAW